MKYAASRPPIHSPHSTLTFVCNLCGARSEVEEARLDRETPTCSQCGSNARWRAVVYALSVAVFGEAMSLPDFPTRTDLSGIGLSDDWHYAEKLAAKLDYRNTFYHCEPRLDITEPPAELAGTLDFLIASDVFEHVAPPVRRAFENALRLLKPGGVFVLTVPAMPNSFHGHIEHFPGLNEYEVVDFKGDPILVNRTVGGEWQVFQDLEFHGGQGEALEIRVFSRASVRRRLVAAGFEEVQEWTEARPEWGLPSDDVFGLPVVARRPLE